MLAFDESIDDALMAGFARFRQIPKMNFTLGIRVGRDATVCLRFICGGRIAAVTFLARHAHLFVFGRMPFKVAIAQTYWLCDLRMTTHAIVTAVIGIPLL